MAFNKSAAAAFANIAGNNPLNDLSSRDKETLWALITTYDGSTKNTPSTDPVEVVRKIAREAGILADRIERELFLSPMAQVFVPHMSGDKDLPVRLTNFSKELIRLIGLTGKPGHHATTFSTQLLITASEFVKLTTDRYNDEHLAELIQSILDKPDFVDLSGDAIRKRRQNFADGYPVLYEFAKTTAKTLSGP